MYQIKENQIRLSVRSLVEFVLRSGSIDNRQNAKVQKDAMQAGSRLHRKIQRMMGSGYQAEVSLKHTVSIGDLELALEGRADGILTAGSGEKETVAIDEIKMVSFDLLKMEAPVPVHQAQAVCYAYMYAVQRQLPSVTVQMTYCRAELEERQQISGLEEALGQIRRFRTVYSFAELEDEFQGYIREFSRWAQFLYQHRLIRDASLQGLQFPFPYREGQRSLVVASYRAMEKEETLFIQAPTGIGKTLSVLFPAAVTMGQGRADKIFYLTAKTITRSVAQEGLSILRQNGARLSFVTITAKEKLCLQEEMDCNPAACPYADGHFDRVNEAVYRLITEHEEISRELLLEYARKYRICPFEFCLDVTYWVDTIICDYNYLFDPNVKLQRFFGDGEPGGGYLFLIDEAHNLVERARDMYSAGLCREEFLAAKQEYAELPSVKKQIGACARQLLALKRECDTWSLLPQAEGTGAFVLALQKLYQELTEITDHYPHWNGTRESSEFFFHVRDFLNVYEQLDENYRVYLEHAEDKTFWIHELCVNPAAQIRACCAAGVSSIFFSATFLPIQYYKELLWGDEVNAVYVRSPFDCSRRMIGIGADVTMRYARRTEEEYGRYAEYIRIALESRKGNYLIFFPSYRCMEEVLARTELPPEYTVLVQEAGMSEQKREAYIDAFRKNDTPVAGFGVIGGIFSEGIDLQKESLIGVIIAGLGLAQVCPRQEILQQFYAEQGKDGYLFAYLYPGMNRVLQAAGRLIRTFEDYGIILLLDERFLRRECREQFPIEWEDRRQIRLSAAKAQLAGFWNSLSDK